jgi:hypothetical protein
LGQRQQRTGRQSGAGVSTDLCLSLFFYVSAPIISVPIGASV